jgi:hypothetical protein
MAKKDNVVDLAARAAKKASDAPVPRTFGGKTLKGRRFTIRPATQKECEERKHWSVGFPLLPVPKLGDGDGK